MKKLVYMTNKEYIEKHLTNEHSYINPAGFCGCVAFHHLQNDMCNDYIECGYKEKCTQCGNLPAKIHNTYIMKKQIVKKTRKKIVPMTSLEWIKKHKPEELYNDQSTCPRGCYELKYGFDKRLCCTNTDGRVNCIECGKLPAKINGKYIIQVVKVND